MSQTANKSGERWNRDAAKLSNPVNQGCSRCERLPRNVANTGSLYLWFPLGHTRDKVAQFLRQSGQPVKLLPDGQGIILALQNAEVKQLAAGLAALLSARELKDTQVLLMSDNSEPQLRDFPRTTSLQRFITLSQSDWLLEIIAAGRISSYFQPIVSAKDPANIFAHEALMRGFDQAGNLVSPGVMFDVAREADLLFQLDLAARHSAIQAAKEHQLRSLIFINFTPSSIYDPAFCLRSTVRAIDQAGIPHHKVVFEVTESDRSQDLLHLQEILSFYRQAGFRMALDDLGAGYSGLNLIHQLRPDFIKLDMELIRNVDQDPYKALIAEKLLDIAQQLEITTVAEGIESQAELAWVQAHGADLVQGYFLARPSASPLTSLPSLPVQK